LICRRRNATWTRRLIGGSGDFLHFGGSFSNLERLLGKWRNPKRKVVRPVLPAPGAPSVDPATGRLTAAKSVL
jgi:hypothetical protein